MKNFCLSLFAAILIAVSFDPAPRSAARGVSVSPNIVISQIYGGGGNSASSQFANDFVELFNRGDQAVSLNGWSTQYASAGGTEFFVTPLSNITLKPGQYYLIQYASGGTNGAALLTPDVIAPQVTNNAGSTFIPNLSGTTGKLALVSSTVRLPASACPSSDPSVVDLVGYGDSASCFEGAKTPNLSITTAAKRNSGGCTDTDNNNSDFTIAAPSPRNTSSPTSSCNLGATLQAGFAASPNAVSPGGNTLLTVSVIPATSPPSTGVTVMGDLTGIGGSAAQAFFDNGTNGDATAGDNVFSFLALASPGLTGGIRTLTAAVSDAQARTVNLSLTLTINAPLPNDDPLILGNPSGASADFANENNYLMPKPQFTLSYNRGKATPNWVAWHLDAGWLGSVQRQDDYRPDPSLPNGWYAVTDQDYSGSGYDRGHMCPSGDRTNTVANNSATFLMTNFIPQLAANNQGPWEDLESYCRALAQAGNELYIIDGPVGNQGTIAGGKIVVPQSTWKVVLVLPNGDDDLSRISKSTRAFGVVVPNFAPVDVNAQWRNFRVTVREVEYLTGYDFFNKIPKITQELIERRRDLQ